MEEILKQLLAFIESQQQKQEILIIETNSQLYQENIASTLESYQKQLRFFIWPSTEYGSAESSQWKEGTILQTHKALMEAMETVDLVLIPSFSRDLLVKGALCMSDTSSSYALQLALMKKKSVVAIDSGINMTLEHWQLQGMDANTAYNNSLALFKDKLVNLGVNFVTVFDFSDFFSRWMKTQLPALFEGKLVEKSEKSADVRTYQDVVGQREITLKPHTKLTNLAQDYLRDKDVLVEYQR